MTIENKSSQQPSVNLEELRAELEVRARELGFDAVGVASVPAELRQDFFFEWLDRGWHGDMQWLAKDPERRAHPENVLPEAQSILCFGLNYLQPEPDRRGRIAKYALGKDYHKIILQKLKQLCRWLNEIGADNRPYVDTGPLLEKPVAALAGIGWQGKNTIVLNPEHGQWLFLGFILTTQFFAPDKPTKDRCGTCTKCIDVCPTRAIPAPYQLDARRCIAYLTIEHKGSIPLEFRRLIGDHLFGCDDCLDVCPWNKWAQKTKEARFLNRPLPDLREMLSWDEETFNERFAGTPIRRLRLHRWKRNICIVLGNIGESSDLIHLAKLLETEGELVTEHAAWAIEEIKTRSTISSAE